MEQGEQQWYPVRFRDVPIEEIPCFYHSLLMMPLPIRLARDNWESVRGKERRARHRTDPPADSLCMGPFAELDGCGFPICIHMVEPD